MAAGVVQKWSDYRKTVVIVYADYRDVEKYISWEMTPTSIGGENVLMITLRFFHWLSIHQVQNA